MARRRRYIFVYALGERLRDMASGFEGIAVSRTEYLSGNVRYGIQPPELKDGKPIDPTWIDQGQLEPVDRQERIGFRADED